MISIEPYMFHCHPDRQLYSAEVSTIQANIPTAAMPRNSFQMSCYDGFTHCFVLEKVERDDEGDIEVWNYKATDSPIRVVIFND